ncbi:MAG: ribonuclease III [Bacteroidales bacterium]|nr:ribonuclease III [Bacteroidales bacterium]
MSLFCSKNKAYCYQLYLLLGFYPRNPEIYKIAFTHSSCGYLAKNGKQINNERLEFVGDAILDAIIADELFVKFPDADEGRLTLMRSQVVKRKSLDSLAIETGVADFIICKSENENNNSHIAGNAFEALIGAIYYDKGFKYCKKFINKIIKEYINLDSLVEKNEDFKSLLLNEANKRKWTVVFDTVENIEESEKDFHYCCSIIINDKFWVEGKEWNKKAAEQNAAKIAYKKIVEK